ncbi:hypothetical protein C8R45DRAFT_943571 [Mycena sanguinolenta]|nr:hypothetical protein C8R45DRAFT_943571 [Mycena sanguinolenta]
MLGFFCSLCQAAHLFFGLFDAVCFFRVDGCAKIELDTPPASRHILNLCQLARAYSQHIYGSLRCHCIDLALQHGLKAVGWYTAIVKGRAAVMLDFILPVLLLPQCCALPSFFRSTQIQLFNSAPGTTAVGAIPRLPIASISYPTLEQCLTHAITTMAALSWTTFTKRPRFTEVFVGGIIFALLCLH